MKEIIITDDMIKKSKKGLVEVYDINVKGVCMMLVGSKKEKE